MAGTNPRRASGPSGRGRMVRMVARTPLAPVAAFPKRLARVARHDANVISTSARWLFTSREHHNYTYDLTRLSREHLCLSTPATPPIDAWFVSVVCDVPVGQVREYFRELASALLRNAGDGHPGRVTSLDINPEAGYLTQEKPWSSVVDLVIGNSIGSIGALGQPVDMFLHDSDHSAEHERREFEHERREFETVEPKLAEGALLVTDNAARTDVLAKYAERTGRRFLAYREQPARHWFPGDGIGIAW